jgi:PRTRC genetic system protein C
MALITKSLKRVFKFERENNTIKLDDINADLTPEKVLDFYAGSYPELTTATIEGPEVDGDTVVYNFITQIGTKG